jgi:hypothetical protein
MLQRCLLAAALLLTLSGVILFQSTSEDGYLGARATIGMMFIGMGSFAWVVLTLLSVRNLLRIVLRK